MTSFSLFDRFIRQGTISAPEGIPDPQYALPSTVNWMRALRLLARQEGIDYAQAQHRYATVQQIPLTHTEENSILEHLVLTVHQLSALNRLKEIDNQADVVRVASVAWYYGIYAAATAMVAAQTKQVQDDHTGTANAWDRHFPQAALALCPFHLRVSSLVKTVAEAEVASLRHGPAQNLIHAPRTASEAHQAVCGYLSGNVKWWAWKTEDQLKKKDRDFRALGVSDFRSKKAREIRDRWLANRSISFLHQAFRFRGKANYREALYLAHGHTVRHTIDGFVADMEEVLRAFAVMAGAFAFKRMHNDIRTAFLDDLSRNRAFTLDPVAIWG